MPAVMRMYKNTCRNYFVHKKIPGDDQVAMIVGGLLDSRIADWINSDCAHIIKLSFANFMVEFRTAYLNGDWEEDTCCEVLGMTQGSSIFWDYTVSLQAKNSLLCGTVSHLPDDKLRHQLGADMEVRLSKKVSSEQLNKVVDFRKWLNEVRRCDEILCVEREEYERIAKDNRESSCRTYNFSEPSSRRVPANNNSIPSAAAPLSASAPRKQCPKLLDSECKLLNENEGCVKCRRFFVDHRAVNCLNDFPNPAAYKSLTQNDVDRAKRSCSKPLAAINTNNASTSSTSFSSDESVVHPVAAVLGMSRNPVAYIAPNGSSILEATSESDTSNASFVSDPIPLVTAVSKSPLEEASPLHIPHLYWKCLTSGRDFPVIFEVLIDHGSSSILISEEYVLKLGLRRKRLRKPYSAELAMEQNGQKVMMLFSEYVKVTLHDPSSYWSSKSVRPIIVPGLCYGYRIFLIFSFPLFAR